MAETKNTFTGSKMNQDLDARLLPNGQYRVAQNIAVSKSEDADVGALENILGNISIATFDIDAIANECEHPIEIIGKYMDSANNRIFVFLTNYVDTSNDKLSNPINQRSEPFARCYIAYYDIVTKTSAIIVGDNPDISPNGGGWLNFSQTHPITGVSMIEDLLFWTDNRNQPRKINVSTAITSPSYYINEDHISVAKYYPFKPLELYEDTGGPAYVTEIVNPGTLYAPSGFSNLLATTLATGGSFRVDCEDDPAAPGTIKTISIRDATNSGTINTGIANGSLCGVYFAGHAGTLCTFKVSTLVSTMRDVVSKYLPIHTVGAVVVGWPGGAQNYIDVTGPKNNIEIGDKITGPTISGDCIIETVTQNVGVSARASFPASGNQTVTAGDVIYFQKQNPEWVGNWTSGNSTWPGDSQFLSDKFVRFSYRFKFDDGEYSLIAPFTQPAFIPVQDGYFVGEDAEEDTYISTIVKFMENKVNDIKLMIPAPNKMVTTLNTVGSVTTSTSYIPFDKVASDLKVKEIDILYKESDGKSIKVIDTIKESEFTNWGTVEYGLYNYQSRAPHKTLPSKEITRVFDQVPVRAMAQETAGNRVMYGNFLDKYSSPPDLTYTVSATTKSDTFEYWDSGTGATISEPSAGRLEYPNHTLKQNRTYQVGIVLSDRWGRQSDVILSNVRTVGDADNKGSTIYHPYRSSTASPALIAGSTTWDTWPGDALNVSFHDVIPDQTQTEGYPGLFKFDEYTIEGIADGGPLTYTEGNTYIVLGGTGSGMSIKVLETNPSPVGRFVEGEIVKAGVGYSNNDIVNPFSGSANITIGVGRENRLGWYSYKIVVKQQEQEYYNVYLPGMLDGYPTTPIPLRPFPGGVGGEQGKSAFIVLLSDNINKVPRDLLEVGPEQKQFNSSVSLYGRVENSINTVMWNKQYFPGTDDDNVNVIGTTNDLGLTDTALGGGSVTQVELYDSSSNPLVAKVAITNAIGLDENVMTGPYLSVYETAPVKSNLDIYWETTTSGLISDLNWNIQNTDSNLPVGMTTPVMNWTEATAHGATISTEFYPINSVGTSLFATTTVQMDSVTDVAGFNINTGGQFALVTTASGYTITLVGPAYYVHWFNQNLNRFTFNFTITRTDVANPVTLGNTSLFYFDTSIANAYPNMLTTNAETCTALNSTITAGNRVLTVLDGAVPAARTGNYLHSATTRHEGIIKGTYTLISGAGFYWDGVWDGTNGSASPWNKGDELVYSVTKVIQQGVYARKDASSIFTGKLQFHYVQFQDPKQIDPQGAWKQHLPLAPITVNYDANGDPDNLFWGMHWWETNKYGYDSNGNLLRGYDPGSVSTTGVNQWTSNDPRKFWASTATWGVTGSRMQGYISINKRFPCGKYDVTLRARDVANTGLTTECTFRVNLVPPYDQPFAIPYTDIFP